MKTFSESYKSEKNSSLIVTPATAVSAKEEPGDSLSGDNGMPVKESPRNNKLKSLGTRGRGSRTESKKSSGGKKWVITLAYFADSSDRHDDVIEENGTQIALQSAVV